jgi:hypothetical protein
VSCIRTCAVPSGKSSITISDPPSRRFDALPWPVAGRTSPFANSGRRDLVMRDWPLNAALRFQSDGPQHAASPARATCLPLRFTEITDQLNSKFRKLNGRHNQPRGHDRQESTPGRTVWPQRVLTALKALVSVVLVLCFRRTPLGSAWEVAFENSSDGEMRWVARDRIGWLAGAVASWVGHSASAAGC